MHIVILGNGISGVTCARNLRKRSDCDITLVSDESDEFFSRTALMYIYMGQMREQDTRPYEPWFWEKNRIQRIRARIERIDFDAKKLFDAQGQSIGYDQLVLALGSVPNKFGWPGQTLEGVQGLYHLQDLASMERLSADLRHAVIVGGGLIGVEMAEMFYSRSIGVTFLVREKAFWGNILPAEEAQMVSLHIREHGIDLRLETELKEILPKLPPLERTVGSVITNKREEVSCGFVGLTAGVSPNIGFLKNSPLETRRGILVDAFLQTSLSDVYAIGDCAEIRQPRPGRRAIEAVWYTGRMMGETLAHNLTATTPDTRIPYDPGIWFNSAKFFDIEYQVYGDIPAQLPDSHATLYWEHPDGKKSIRINYEHASGKTSGFNLMGIRYRHEVCERWLSRGEHIETVLQNLGLANFDPEFSTQHEAALLDKYKVQTGKSLTLQQNRGLRGVLRFLAER